MQLQAVEPGQTLGGKYRIDRVLGAGAMGMVLAATHLVLGSRVAIKIMLGGGKRGPEHEARFLREARVASMLRSEHAGKVLDVGTTEQGATFIVMEYLDGRDLGALLEARGPLPVEEAVTYVLQACEAIAEAHGLGIVHRDIKPANLFLTTGVSGAPCVKVVDFGIAKQSDETQALTQTGAALGSPLYMSPEQMRGSRDVDARSDIWALGVTLYQLLAGATPFDADTLMAVVSIVQLEPPTPLARYRADVAPHLIAAIHQCFEKDPARRWQSVAAFAAALAPHGSGLSAGYAARVARVQQVDVTPSRPTTELPAPSGPRIVAAASASPASASPATLASATRADSLAIVAAAPRSPASGTPAGRITAITAAVLLLAALPIAVYVSLRGRAGERVEGPAIPALSVTAIPPASPATSASPTVEPADLPPAEAPSAAPSTPPTPTAPRARSSASATPRLPAAPPNARPRSGVVGGERR